MPIQRQQKNVSTITSKHLYLIDKAKVSDLLIFNFISIEKYVVAMEVLQFYEKAFDNFRIKSILNVERMLEKTEDLYCNHYFLMKRMQIDGSKCSNNIV